MNGIDYLVKDIHQADYLVCITGLNMIREMKMRHYKDSEKAYEVELSYGESPEELYSAQCFNTRPEAFYRFYREEMLKHIDTEPGKAFYALAAIQKKGYIKSILTKEIYNMLQKAGCQKVFSLHGNIYEHNRCTHCGKEFPVEYLMKRGKVPLCDQCEGIIHPGTTLMGEMVSNYLASRAAEEVSKADLLLVVGANLKASICREYIQYFQGDKLILINPEEHYSDNVADTVFHERLEDFLPRLAEKL